MGAQKGGFENPLNKNQVFSRGFSEGEKPPKIRKKSSQEQSSWELFGPPPTEKTEKIGKIKGTLVRKVPGNLRSQEFVFFLVRFFCPLVFRGFFRLKRAFSNPPFCAPTLCHPSTLELSRAYLGSLCSPLSCDFQPLSRKGLARCTLINSDASCLLRSTQRR